MHPEYSIHDRILWIFVRHIRSNIDTIEIFSSLILSPLFETFIFLITYYCVGEKRRGYFIVFLAGLFLHEPSLNSLGKAFAFMLIYYAGIRFITMIPNRRYLSLYVSMASIHAVWNICGLAFHAYILTLSLPPLVPTRF
jgi:hypothetical protein